MVDGPVVPGFAGGREVQDFLPNGPFNRRFVVGQLPGHGHQSGGAVAVSVLSVGELVDSATSRGGLALPVLVARATRRRPGLHDVGRGRGRWVTGAGRRSLRQKRDKVEVSPVQDVDLLRPATHPGPRRVFLREARNGKVAGIAAKGANDGVAPSLEVQEGGRVAPAAATQLAADSFANGFVGGSGFGAIRIRKDQLEDAVDEAVVSTASSRPGGAGRRGLPKEEGLRDSISVGISPGGGGVRVVSAPRRANFGGAWFPVSMAALRAHGFAGFRQAIHVNEKLGGDRGW